MKQLLLTLAFILFVGSAEAATRYASPTGGGSACTVISTPCTIATAIGQLVAGDTLILLNGTYNTTGILIDCNAGAVNGTSVNPITIRAQNERQAFLNFTGSSFVSTLEVKNCSDWRVEGLRLSGNNSSSASGILMFRNTTRAWGRRNIVHHVTVNNTAAISNCYGAYDGALNTLFEENECYMPGYGFQGHGDNGTIFRRNYCRRPAYPGYSACIANYPGLNATIENNIDENGGLVYISISKNTATPNTNNRAYGNIAFNDSGIVWEECAENTPARPSGLIAKDNVGVTNQTTQVGQAINNAGGTSVVFENNSVWGNFNKGFTQEIAGDAGGCAYPISGASVSGKNNLAVSNTALQGLTNPSGFYFPDGTWSFQKSNAFGNTTNYSPSTSDGRWNGTATTTAPSAAQLLCPGFIIPVSSGLKGAGLLPGEDIGANVNYIYINGVKQGQIAANLFWSPTTRQVNPAFVGAPVVGVNDTIGLFNFGSRFHPNCALANFPQGGGPIVTITTNSGNNFSTSSSTATLTGTATGAGF